MFEHSDLDTIFWSPSWKYTPLLWNLRDKKDRRREGRMERGRENVINVCLKRREVTEVLRSQTDVPTVEFLGVLFASVVKLEGNGRIQPDTAVVVHHHTLRRRQDRRGQRTRTPRRRRTVARQQGGVSGPRQGPPNRHIQPSNKYKHTV